MSQPRTSVTARITDNLVPHFRRVRPYAPVEPPERQREESGLREDEIIRLNANENPYGAVDSVRAAISSFEAASIYPDPEQAGLRAALSEYVGVARERIVAGAGSDELIDLIARLFVTAGDAIVTAVPTFGMYEFTADLVGARFVAVRRRDDFSLDVEPMVEAARSSALVYLASPNNPTGNSLSVEELRAVLETGTPTVVDEAYVEFSDSSMLPIMDDYPNLIILRTFSKWAGLAGVRVGYGIFPPDLAAVLMVIKPPYSVSTLAQQAAITAIRDRERILRVAAAMVRDRELLATELRALPGVFVYPSDANFLLVRFSYHDAASLHSAMGRRGIALRSFDTPGLENCIRISVGRPQDHQRLLAALQQEMEAQP